MKTISANISECVGPLCSSLIPRRMSASGSIERTRIRGMLRFVFRSFAEDFPSR